MSFYLTHTFSILIPSKIFMLNWMKLSYLLLLASWFSFWKFKLDDENAWPKQFLATHEYVPSDDDSMDSTRKANVSPALIFLPSLYQKRFGVGTPITLHSRETVPSSARIALSSSTNWGALYAFGTGTKENSNSFMFSLLARYRTEEFYAFLSHFLFLLINNYITSGKPNIVK